MWVQTEGSHRGTTVGAMGVGTARGAVGSLQVNSRFMRSDMDKNHDEALTFGPLLWS